MGVSCHTTEHFTSAMTASIMVGGRKPGRAHGKPTAIGWLLEESQGLFSLLDAFLFIRKSSYYGEIPSFLTFSI